MAVTMALAALSSVVPNAARADTWNSGDKTITAGAPVSAANTGLQVGAGPGSVGTLSNSGVITGTENGATDVYGARNTIGNTIGRIDNASGGTITADSASGLSYGVGNDGAITALDNSGLIHGGQSGINNTGTITSLNNLASGNINGANSAGSSAAGILNGGTIGTLSNSGAISGTSNAFAIQNNGSIGMLLNNAGGTIKASSFSAVDNERRIGTLSNSGLIMGNRGPAIRNGSRIDQLDNNGTILSSRSSALYSEGRIGILSNSGTIKGSSGILSSGSLGTLNNYSGGTIIGTGAWGFSNGDTITSLNNFSGAVISGKSSGLVNNGGFDTLTNSGTILSSGNSGYGIMNGGVIGALVNSGTIAASRGTGIGIDNLATISVLSNSGLITGNMQAIFNETSGILDTITNGGTSGGTIAGAILNQAARDLTFLGGAGTVAGTLTGSGAGFGIGANNIGNITNTRSNLIFGGGRQLLNDNINVGANVVSNAAGVLQINNAIGITGNYVQNAGATLLIGVGDNAITSSGTTGDSGYGRLTVSGSARIAAGSTVALTKVNSYGFASGQRYIVIAANTGGTDYNADRLIYTAPGFIVTGASIVDGTNTDLLLTLGGSLASLATTSNAVTALNGLFNYGGTDAALMNLFNAGAALDSTAAANKAGAQLSPAATTSAANRAAVASTQAVSDMIVARIDTFRAPGQGIAKINGEGGGIATGESARGAAVWGQGFGGQSVQDQRNNVAGYHAGYNGLLIGADTALGENWRVGGLGSYVNTSVANDGDNSGSAAHVNSYGLIGYAGYSAPAWYLDFSGGAVRHRYNTTRALDFTGFSGNAVGSYQGMQYAAAVQGGYPIALDGWMAGATLTPIAGLRYSTLRQDAYAETGGNGAALNVTAASNASLKSELGVKLESWLRSRYGEVIPSAQLRWRHEYRNDPQRSTVSFVADATGATGFTAQGPAPAADSGVLSLGVTLVRGDNLRLSAGYTLDASAGFIAQTADLRLRYAF